MYAFGMRIVTIAVLLLLAVGGDALAQDPATHDPTKPIPAFANFNFGDSTTIVNWKIKENVRIGSFENSNSVRIGRDLFELDFGYTSGRLSSIYLWGPDNGEESAKDLCMLLRERYGSPTREKDEQTPCKWSKPFNSGQSASTLSMCSKYVDWRWITDGKQIDLITCWKKSLGSMLDNFTNNDDSSETPLDKGPANDATFSFQISIYDYAALQQHKHDREQKEKRNRERSRELFR